MISKYFYQLGLMCINYSSSMHLTLVEISDFDKLIHGARNFDKIKIYNYEALYLYLYDV